MYVICVKLNCQVNLFLVSRRLFLSKGFVLFFFSITHKVSVLHIVEWEVPKLEWSQKIT